MTTNTTASIDLDKLDELRMRIENILSNHRMVRMYEVEDDGTFGNSYPLIDRLCLDDGRDIQSGQDEIEAIADAIVGGIPDELLIQLGRRSTSGSDGTAAAGAGGLPPYEVVVALNSLRWMLNKSDQCDKPNMRATTLLDKHHSKDGKTIRQNLETLWRYFDTNRPEMTALLLSGGDRQAATSGSELAPDADLDYLLEYITVSAAHSAAQRKVAELRALAQQAATCQPLADERALPPLPEARVRSMNPLDKPTAFTADQMREYGTACASAALAHQSPSIDQQGGAPADSGEA